MSVWDDGDEISRNVLLICLCCIFHRRSKPILLCAWVCPWNRIEFFFFFIFLFLARTILHGKKKVHRKMLEASLQSVIGNLHRDTLHHMKSWANNQSFLGKKITLNHELIDFVMLTMNYFGSSWVNRLIHWKWYKIFTGNQKQTPHLVAVFVWVDATCVKTHNFYGYYNLFGFKLSRQQSEWFDHSWLITRVIILWSLSGGVNINCG